MYQRRTMLFVSFLAIAITAKAQTPFASGLQAPQRLAFTARGSLIVSEGGTQQPNSGRLSILDRDGTRRSLMEGLPSGLAHYTIPWGPKGIAIDGRVLYLAIGDGDVTAGTPPDHGINPNGPSSPIFSSVLRLEFSADIDDVQGPFTLALVDHWALLDGYDVEVASGNAHLRIRALAAYRPLVRNVLAPGVAVRTSEPTGLFLDKANQTLYVTDASGETVSKIALDTGRSLTLIRFTPMSRGDQQVNNTPSAVCGREGKLLVSFLTEAPFPQGEASLRQIDPGTGAVTTWADGLTAVVDMACLSSGSVAVAEVTLDYANTLVPSGRVQLVGSSGKRMLTDKLPLPNSIARDPVSGDLFVGTLTGFVFRIALP
jgi:hypothetical protein